MAECAWCTINDCNYCSSEVKKYTSRKEYIKMSTFINTIPSPQGADASRIYNDKGLKPLLEYLNKQQIVVG